MAEAESVTLHLGRDDFAGMVADVPMARDAATGRWQAVFTVPESPKWNLAFCFFDPEENRWHDNHARNWQALVAREW